MKKRKIIERRKALKEAYYNELKKAGVISTQKIKTLDEMTKKELIELALSEGLELDNKLTKAVMIEKINNHILEENNKKTPVLVIQDTPTQEETSVDGTIEEIDIPDVSEKQVQAINEIVEESREETPIEVH